MRFRTIVRAAVTAAQDDDQAMIFGSHDASWEQRMLAARHNYWTQRATQLLNDRRKAATRCHLV
jgi:hypothetical protein